MDKTVLNMLLMCLLVTCILVGNVNAQVFYTEGDLRLTGPQASTNQGILEIIHNNVWGTVCNDHFDMNDAEVVCRQLKYLPAENITYLGSGTGPIWLDDVACVNTEQRLEDCPHVGWNNSNCHHSQDVGIVCSAPTPQPQPQINENWMQPRLNCSEGYLRVFFNRSLNPSLTEDQLAVTFPQNSTQTCNIGKGIIANNTIYVYIPYEECSSNKTFNATHIIYSTFITYLPPQDGSIITRQSVNGVQVQCEIWRNATNHKASIPLTETLSQRASGTFKTGMIFFSNATFDTPVSDYPLRILVNSLLNVGVELEDVDPNLKIIVTDCFATPTADRSRYIRYNLISNKCKTDSTVEIIPIQNNTWYGFQFRTFKFIGSYDEVHLHCDAYICGSTETKVECNRNCSPSTGRRKRSVDLPVVHVSSPTILIYNPEDPTQPIANKETRPDVKNEILFLAMTLAMALAKALM